MTLVIVYQDTGTFDEALVEVVSVSMKCFKDLEIGLTRLLHI